VPGLTPYIEILPMLASQLGPDHLKVVFAIDLHTLL